MIHNPIIVHLKKEDEKDFIPYEEIGLLIPEETVSFQDTQMYHNVPMYKILMAYHIGMTTRTITLNQHPILFPENGLFHGSFPKANEIHDYTQCKKPARIKFEIQENQAFECVSIMDSFTPGAIMVREGRIVPSKFFGVRRGLTLFLSFNIGIREYYEKVTSEMLERFMECLYAFGKLIPRIRQIVCCGHSTGMTQATLFTFLLLCAQQPDYLEENHSLFEEDCDLRLFRPYSKRLSHLSFFVVGSGGSPVLFNRDQFELFYERLRGRYVHVLSALQTKSRFFIDSYGHRQQRLFSVKFGVYVTEQLNKHPQYKYTGDPCPISSFISNGDDGIQDYISHSCERETIEDRTEIEETSSMTCSDALMELHQFDTYRKLLSIFSFETLGKRKKSKKKNKK